jgi:putative nucleotidyltransferase with HDIG domain
MKEVTKSILFVDDDIEIISSTRRFLHTNQPGWQVTFANSASEALQKLNESTFDVVITDIRMPGMSGIELLDQIRLHYPQMARIALSGHADRESSLKVSDLAHQYLVKPCPIETIITTIQKTLVAANLIMDDKVRQLIVQLKTIPSQPETYLAIVDELKKADPSVGRVGEIITRDPSMAAKILQLVNSPFFGLPQTVIDPGQASVLLGVDTIRDLVLIVGIFSQFDSRKLARLKLGALWDHSQRTGQLAKSIAIHIKANSKQINDAMVAGLLHDVGKLILADNFPQQYFEVNRLSTNQNQEVNLMEQKVFGVNHSQVGAYLFGLWGLSEFVQDAVAYHHEPMAAKRNDHLVLIALHAANVLDYQVNKNQPRVGAPPDFQSEFILSCGVEWQVKAWKQAALKKQGG